MQIPEGAIDVQTHAVTDRLPDLMARKAPADAIRRDDALPVLRGES